jgi:hypothetical protein
LLLSQFLINHVENSVELFSIFSTLADELFLFQLVVAVCSVLILASVMLAAVDFFNQASVLYGTLMEFCTPATCPTMSAGQKYSILLS